MNRWAKLYRVPRPAGSFVSASWDNRRLMAERGFVLTPTYRVVAGRPEVHLYAVLESGEPALIVDDRTAQRSGSSPRRPASSPPP
jgi:hypothetical protein